jgi:hypothetical protein
VGILRLCPGHVFLSVYFFFLFSPFLARFPRGAASPCVLRPSLRLLLVILPHKCLCECLTFIHPSSFILLVRSFIRPLDPAVLSSPLRHTDLRLRCKLCLFISRTRLPSIYPTRVQHAEEKARLFIVYPYSSFSLIPPSLTFRCHCIYPTPLLHPHTIALLHSSQRAHSHAEPSTERSCLFAFIAKLSSSRFLTR